MLSPGIAGERERRLGMDVLHHLRITTGLPDSHQSNTGICKPSPGHLSPSRTETKRAVFYQRLTEVYKINSQSPSGNLLFPHAEKIRHDFKGALCSCLTAKGEGPSPSSGGWRGWGERGRRRHDRESGAFSVTSHMCAFGGFPPSAGYVNIFHQSAGMQ